MVVTWAIRDKPYKKKYPVVMATIWEDKMGERFCLLYNYGESMVEVEVKGKEISVEGKSFKVETI